MAKIHDWNRVYWNNAKGTREYDPNGIDPDDSVMCIYENSHGDRVAYRLADRRATVEAVADVSELEEDEDNDNVVGQAIDAALEEAEEQRGFPIKDATESDREEQDDEVTVTLDVQFDIPKYEVEFNGELITDVQFEEGSRWFHSEEELQEDEDKEQRPEQVDEARFGTRAEAREFAAAWREDFGEEEQLGYVDYSYEEVMEMSYQEEVVPLAKDYGVFPPENGDKSHESLAQAISGEEPPEPDEDEEAESEEAEAEA